MAGATKSAIVKWEKDEASPNAKALIAWAEAGADVLYILTGRRIAASADLDIGNHEDTLALVRQELLNAAGYPRPGESAESAADRLVADQVRTLREILDVAGDYDNPNHIEEAKSLLEIATDPLKLAAYRAAEHAQMREKRATLRRIINITLEIYEPRPSETAMNLMVEICLTYGVPAASIAELALQLMEDGGRWLESRQLEAAANSERP